MRRQASILILTRRNEIEKLNTLNFLWQLNNKFEENIESDVNREWSVNYLIVEKLLLLLLSKKCYLNILYNEIEILRKK